MAIRNCSAPSLPIGHMHHNGLYQESSSNSSINGGSYLTTQSIIKHLHLSHFGGPWWGQHLSKSLYLSQALYNDSWSNYVNEVISFLIFVVFVGGKNLARSFWARSSQVVIELVGNDFNNTFTLSHNKKGNSLKWIASPMTPLCLNV